MKEQLSKRLEELKEEFESGQKVMSELEIKQKNLKETMLRISGAIQVLEEELQKAQKPTEAESKQAEDQHQERSEPESTLMAIGNS